MTAPTLPEAARMALEALYETERLAGSAAYPASQVADAITALRAALAASEAQVEPVATLHDDGYWTPKQSEAGRLLNDRLMRAGSRVDVYTHPPAPQQPAPAERGQAPNCGACPGDGSICPAACRLAEDSPPAERGEQPLPLLVRDLAADLGVDALTACQALRALGLGDYSVNMAVTATMAKALRQHFGERGEQTAQGVAVTDQMARAYLEANKAYWHEVDEGPRKPGVWRNGTPHEATLVGLRAALASAPRVPKGLQPLGLAVVDSIANDGCRNAAGGIYSTRVQEFALEVQRAFAQQNGMELAAAPQPEGGA